VLLYALWSYITTGEVSAAPNAEGSLMEGMDEALGWYGWACRCVWAPLWWVLAAFRWSALPVTVTDGAGRVDGSIEDDDGELGWAEADVTGVDDAATAGTASAVASSGGLGAAFGQRSGSVRAAFGLWGQLWVDNPPGTFLFDHWIAATLAAIVIAISFRCGAFSQILGRRFLASFSRHLAHSPVHHDTARCSIRCYHRISE